MLDGGSVVTWVVAAVLFDAFAAIRVEAVTWGNAAHGTGSALQEQLKNVQDIQATEAAFAKDQSLLCVVATAVLFKNSG